MPNWQLTGSRGATNHQAELNALLDILLPADHLLLDPKQSISANHSICVGAYFRLTNVVKYHTTVCGQRESGKRDGRFRGNVAGAVAVVVMGDQTNRFWQEKVDVRLEKT